MRETYKLSALPSVLYRLRGLGNTFKFKNHCPLQANSVSLPTSLRICNAREDIQAPETELRKK